MQSIALKRVVSTRTGSEVTFENGITCLNICKPLHLIFTVLAHGTYLGHIRLEAHKPQQVPIDSTVSFGASTRTYTIREKPQAQGTAGTGDSKTGEDEELKGLLGLPEEETELEVR